jgi:hypothetical protein
MQYEEKWAESFSPRNSRRAARPHGQRDFSEEMKRNSKREDELIREGWTRRFVANKPRLSEVVELYRSMGHEVYLEPIPLVNSDTADEETGECRICFKGSEDQYKIIYTRPETGDHEEDDLP